MNLLVIKESICASLLLIVWAGLLVASLRAPTQLATNELIVKRLYRQLRLNGVPHANIIIVMHRPAIPFTGTYKNLYKKELLGDGEGNTLTDLEASFSGMPCLSAGARQLGALHVRLFLIERSSFLRFRSSARSLGRSAVVQVRRTRRNQ